MVLDCREGLPGDVIERVVWFAAVVVAVVVLAAEVLPDDACMLVLLRWVSVDV